MHIQRRGPILWFLIGFFAGAASFPLAIVLWPSGVSSKTRPFPTSLSFYLSPEEVTKAEGRANIGYAEDSYKLYLHYQLAIGDKAIARSWLTSAAKNGHISARKTLLDEYINDYFNVPEVARKGIEDATSQGWAGAQQALDKILHVETPNGSPHQSK